MMVWNVHPRLALLVRVTVCLGLLASGLVAERPVTAQVEQMEASAGQAIRLGAPVAVAGFDGRGDQRDADLNPVVAYQHTWGVYLVVWMSLANATGSGSGFDLYGRYLDVAGRPLGSPFRISDSNTVARSSKPVVVAGANGFLVVWTRRGSPCRLYAQWISVSGTSSDQAIELGIQQHQHSPALVYVAERDLYLLTYVAGDDYMPPKLFNAETADCGNNAASTSQIRVAELAIDVLGQLRVGNELAISESRGGAFRPQLAYHDDHRRALVVWEDRRLQGGNPYRFDVYAQRIDDDSSAVGMNLALASGTYGNSDTSATWTPRPVVTADGDGFYAAWFEARQIGGGTTWGIYGRSVTAAGVVAAALPVTQVTIAAPPAGQAPTGFLALSLDQATNHRLIAASSHMETLWGYYSSVRLQRMAADGALMTLEGNPQTGIQVGAPLDLALDDQYQVALAQRAVSSGYSEHLLVYARHAQGKHSQDFDIWAVRLVSNSLEYAVYLPSMRR